MKKVLIITYYWPPENGVGVQRILKFCNFLPEFGYQPVVLTANPKKLNFIQTESGIEIARVFYWFDPTRWVTGNITRKVSAAASSSPKSSKYGKIKAAYNYLLHFIWLNFFIPDSKIGWYFPARKAMDNLLKKNDIAVIITTGPPYTVHLIGLYAKNRYGLPWIVDARDPWVEQVGYNVIDRFGYVKAINEKLERKVYSRADQIITVGELLANLIKTKTAQKGKVKVIYNGYDESEFTQYQPRKNSKFQIGHYGSILDDQIPYFFLKALGQKILQDSEFANNFVFEFYGPITEKTKHEIEAHLPERNRNFHDNLSRTDLIKKMADEQMLFLLINSIKPNELIVSSKIFEYLRTGWPVLIIGPVKGEAGNLVRMTSVGKIFEYDEMREHLEFVLKTYHEWKNNGMQPNAYKNVLFERREQTKQLAQNMDLLTTAH